MSRATLPFEAYLQELELDALALSAEQRARIEQELRDHLADAAVEQGADPEDPTYQRALIITLGRSEDMARAFHAVYAKSYHWCALVSMLGLGVLCIVLFSGALPMIQSDFIQVMFGCALMIGVFGLYGRYGAQVGRAGRAGLGISMLSLATYSALTGLRQLSTSSETYLHWWGEEAANLFYPLFYAGLLLFGVMVLRKRPFPRWNILPLLFGGSGTLAFLLGALFPMGQTPLTQAIGAVLGIAALVGWLGTFMVLWSDRRAEPAI